MKRRYRRSREVKLLAGVAGGLAEHLSIDVLAVRLAFVLLTALGGFGFLLYAALWVIVPQERATVDQPPGLAAAERSGMGPRRRIRMRVGDAGQLVAFGVLTVGLGILFQSTAVGVSPVIFWPALVIA